MKTGEPPTPANPRKGVSFGFWILALPMIYVLSLGPVWKLSCLTQGWGGNRWGEKASATDYAPLLL